MRSNVRLFLSCASVIALLAACGGGDAPPPAQAPVPPAPATITITSQPSSLTVVEGEPASFSIAVQTTSPFTVEWSRDGVVIAGRSGTTFTLAAATLADDGALFSARVLAGVNSPSGSTVATVTSSAARLSVNIAAPAAPTALTALAGASGTTALLSWTDNSNNETGFEVFSVVNGQDVLVATTAANDRTQEVNGLTPGSEQTFRVRAKRSVSGRLATSVLASTTVALPGGSTTTPNPPTNARLTPVSGNMAIDLAWTDNSNNETGFELFNASSGSEVLVTVLGANTTEARLNTSLTPGQTLTFGVRAVRSANGTTTRSAPASASITLPAAQTQIVTLTPTQDNVLRISTFDASVGDQVLRNLPVEVGCTYVIDFGAAGSAATCSRSLLLFDLGVANGRTIRKATLRLQPVAGVVNFAPIREFRIGAVQQSWNPATVTGNNGSFTVSTTGLVSAPLAALMLERSFDVTSIVSQWASGAQTNNGFALAMIDETIPGNLAAGLFGMFNSFGSRENSIAGNRPRLVIEFE